MLGWTRIDWQMQMSESSRGQDKKPIVNNNPKTIQAMGAFKYLYDHNEVKDIVIVCKKSIKYQWMDEIQTFLNLDADIYIADDNKKKREKTYDEIKNNPKKTILIINYHLLLNDSDLIKCDMTVYKLHCTH